MKEKIKEKGFIQIPLLVGIIVAVVITSAVGTGVVLYKHGKLAPLIANISQTFTETEEPITTQIEGAGQEELSEQPSAEEELMKSQLEQELEQARLGAERAKKEAEKIKLENERLKAEQELEKAMAEQQKLQNQQNQLPPPNSVLCNGKYWTACPAGQKFSCPAIGDPKCLIENTQTSVDLQSGPSIIGDCLRQAIERYRAAEILADAEKKKCEEKHGPMSMFCLGVGDISISTYYSSCLGTSRVSDSKSMYSSPPPSYEFDDLKRQLDEQKKELDKQKKEIGEQKREFEKYQFDQSLDCTLSGGYYIGNICYPSLLK